MENLKNKESKQIALQAQHCHWAAVCVWGMEWMEPEWKEAWEKVSWRIQPTKPRESAEGFQNMK